MQKASQRKTQLGMPGLHSKRKKALQKYWDQNNLFQSAIKLWNPQSQKASDFLSQICHRPHWPNNTQIEILILCVFKNQNSHRKKKTTKTSKSHKLTQNQNTQYAEKKKKHKRSQYLILLDPLHRYSIPTRLVGGNVGVPELAVAQQLPNRVATGEILGVPEVRALPTGDHPALPPRRGLVLGPQLMRPPLVRLALLLIGGSLLFLRCDYFRLRVGALFTVVIDRVVVVVGAIRAPDSVGRNASTHDWKTDIQKEKQSFLEVLTDQSHGQGLEYILANIY